MATKKQSRNYNYSFFLRSSEHKNQNKTSDHSQGHMHFVETREVIATQSTEEINALQTTVLLDNAEVSPSLHSAKVWCYLAGLVPFFVGDLS